MWFRAIINNEKYIAHLGNKVIHFADTQRQNYLNSIGVATKFASITLGVWQRFPINAIAMPHRITVTPVRDPKRINNPN